MARGVQESDGLSVGECHVIGADVLRDTARLPTHHVGLADIVQKRSLAVVYVAHHSHHWRPFLEVLFPFLNLGLDRSGGNILLFPNRVEAKLARNQIDLVEIQP